MKCIGYFRELPATPGLKLFSQIKPDELVNETHVALYSPDLATEQRVVAAANRYGDIIVVSARHHDTLMNAQLKRLKEAGILATTHTRDQGFIDNYGSFLTREEALVVAREAGQLNLTRPKGSPEQSLFSEDLY